MNIKTLIFLFAATIAMASGLYAQNLMVNKPENTIPALQFKLPDMTGKIRDSSEWQGKIRIINFWATWCPPCLKEIPEFIHLQNEYKDKGLQFIGIAIEDKESVEEYLTTISINYPILIGGDEGIEMSRQMGNYINAVPYSLILDQKGQVVHTQPGELSEQKIRQIISPLLKNSQ